MSTTTDAYLAGYADGLNAYPYDTDEWSEEDTPEGDLVEAYDSGYRDGHFQKELDDLEGINEDE